MVSMITDCDFQSPHPSLVVENESDAPLRDSRQRLHVLDFARQAVDILDQHPDHRRRTIVAAFELFHARFEVFVRGHQFAHPDEGADNGDAHVNI